MIFVFFYSRTNFFEVIPILFCGTMLGDIIPFIFGLDPPKVAFVGDISPFMGKSGIYIKKFHFEKNIYIFLKLINTTYYSQVVLAIQNQQDLVDSIDLGLQIHI